MFKNIILAIVLICLNEKLCAISAFPFEDVFIKYDTDNDGHLSKENLTQIYNADTNRTPKESVDLMFKIADENRDGLLDKNEFELITSGKIYEFTSEVSLNRIFTAFDKEKTGFIQKDSLKELYSTLTGKSAKDLDATFDQFDADKNKKFDFGEFMNVINFFGQHPDLLQNKSNNSN